MIEKKEERLKDKDHVNKEVGSTQVHMHAYAPLGLFQNIHQGFWPES